MRFVDPSALAKLNRQVRPEFNPDMMMLDEQTLKDLEIMESEHGGKNLFDFCNCTRNKKGAIRLRARMERPWSNPARIRAVQESLSLIIGNREAFDSLPSFVITEIVERYFHDALPLVSSINKVEFFFGVIDLRYIDVIRYFQIMRGVTAVASVLCALRKIVKALESISLSGELADILEEMRTLLALSKLSQIPDLESVNLSAWKVLRLDQVFRIHEQTSIYRLLQLTYELDALMSMADTCAKHDFIMPEIKDGALSVEAKGVVHPLFQDMVANPVELSQNRRMLFLTGPNMAGKTTYLRACAIALYFAHMGMGVPAESFSFVPAQSIFSSIVLSDNLHNGVSFFHAEALRIKKLAQLLAGGYRVIAFMDEPFKGTNVKDAYDASSAIMERFSTKEGSLFMFSSHLIELCDQMSAIDQIDCRYFEAGEEKRRLTFNYLLRPGVSSQRLGMRVLQEEGVFELLDGKKRTLDL